MVISIKNAFILLLLLMLVCSMCKSGFDDLPEPWMPVFPSFHVTVNGTPAGDGSIDAPWDLATALSRSTVVPGDTIYLHGGTYKGFFVSNLNGTAAAPIVILPWHNDTVIIDGTGQTASAPAVLTFEGSYTWLKGVTITNSAANHYNADNTNDGVYFIGPGNKLQNCIIRGNSGNGIGFWNPAVNAEVSGCIIYNNGAIGPNRGHGHGLYVQQGTAGVKTIRNNIIFNSFGKGIQVYGTSVEVHNTVIEDNIFFDAALPAGMGLEQSVYIGGIMKVDNHVVRNNVFYASPGHPGTPASAKFGDAFGMVPSETNGKAVFSGNYCVDSFLHITRRWEHMTARDNTYIAKSSANRIVVGYDVYDHAGMTRDYDSNVYHRGMIGENNATGFSTFPLSAIQEYDGQEMNSVYHENLPNQSAVFVKQVDVDRWHVAIFNWRNARSITVALPNLKSGAGYEIFYAPGLQSRPVAKGNYNGNFVTIPLDASAADIPLGMETHAARFTGTLPDFGAFLIIGR